MVIIITIIIIIIIFLCLVDSSFVSPAVTWDGFQEDKGLKKMKGRTSVRRYLTAMFFIFYCVCTGAPPQSKPRKLPPDR